jgi:hypothetical protein
MRAVIERNIPPELSAKVDRLVAALARLAAAQDHATSSTTKASKLKLYAAPRRAPDTSEAA